MCRSCYNSHPAVKKADKDKKKKRFADINYYIRCRTAYLKNHSKIKNIIYNLDFDYLLKLWNDQNSLCYYTKIQMLRTTRENNYQTWNTPSIDRKNPDLGYTKGNVVWCISSVNSFKQSLTEEEFNNMTKSIKWWWN